MKERKINAARLTILLLACSALNGCDDMRVYGSVGVSSFSGGGWGSPGFGTSVSVGGRIL